MWNLTLSETQDQLILLEHDSDYTRMDNAFLYEQVVWDLNFLHFMSFWNIFLSRN